MRLPMIIRYDRGERRGRERGEKERERFVVVLCCAWGACLLPVQSRQYSREEEAREARATCGAKIYRPCLRLLYLI